MKSQRMLALVGVAALAVSLSACAADDSPSSTSSATSGGEIVFGLDEDSTGPGASYATIAGKTIRMAVNEINAAGGIGGKKIRIVVGNDESDPTKTPTVVRKLVDDGAQVLLLDTGSGAVLQGKSVVKQAAIPAIAPTAVTTSVALAPDNEFTYMLANGVDQFAKAYCGAMQKEGHKSIAVLSDASPAINNINKLIIPILQGCVKVLAQETAPVDVADLTAQVARIKESGPDAVLVSSLGGNFEVLAQNTLFQQMPGVRRFSLASIGNQPDSWSRVDKGALADVVYMGALDKGNPKTAELTKKLKKLNGNDYRLTAYDAQAYDSVYLMKQAIEAAGGADNPTAVRDQLNKISGYKASFGQAGFTLSFSADKHGGADGLCGLVLSGFDKNNQPTGAWPEYQVPCKTN
ncbi:ABC transporter substrate-binding protein [Microbacterium panaciterrae]|uniref:ABC transporter substrate-binding protein n=1 Tax=Microbacterium panaciterrae TaxID=985759 RepID=A0ABP8PLH3_9MICO